MRTSIDDCAKDGGEEFFTEIQCNRIPIESLKICNSNAVHVLNVYI